jgi:hypothetical protein
MIRASKEPVAWPVPWNLKQTFFFRAGDVIERAELEGDLDGEHRSRAVYPFELQAAFEEGITALLGADSPDGAEFIALSASEAAGETIAPAQAAQLEAVRETLIGQWPPYKALKAREARRLNIVPVQAFIRYCTGWQGEGLPEFKKGRDGMVSLTLLSDIPDLVLRAGGAFAYSLQYASGETKNSGAPLPSDKGPPTSTSDTHPADGK